MMQAAEGQLLYIAVQEQAWSARGHVRSLETLPAAADQLLYVFCSEEGPQHCSQVVEVSHNKLYCTL